MDLPSRRPRRNVGWRIDYHVVSDDLADSVRKAEIWMDVHGSDHCPIVVDLDV